MPHRIRVPLAALAAMGVMLGLATVGNLASDTSQAEHLPLPPADELRVDARTSLLVISPHPDDESLCCAGAITGTLRAGGRVSILWMTSGDGSRIDALLVQRSLLGDPATMRALGARRMREAREAAARLGVAADAQYFLGYPDGGLAALSATDGTVPHRSRTTGVSEVPYPDALSPGHPYTRQGLEADLARVLERVHPTLILAPGTEDRHPDHRATGLITRDVLRRRGELPALRSWIVHGPLGWPAPPGLFEPLPLPVPAHASDLQPLTLALDAQAEARKLAAIRAYRTQMQVMSPFLLAFVRTNEIYFKAVPAGRPPATE